MEMKTKKKAIIKTANAKKIKTTKNNNNNNTVS